MAISETLGGNITMVEGGDVFDFKGSGAISEGRLVVPNTDISDVEGGVAVVQAAGANALNVLGYVEATYEASDRVRVKSGGIARLFNNSGATISNGQLVGPAASGNIKDYDAVGSSSGTVIGVALEDITNSAFGKVFVNLSYAVQV